MATSTTEMQEMQAAERGVDTNLSTTAPSAQNSPLGLAKGTSLPKLNEILAQPAVKKATPGIMIAVLLVFLVASYMAMQDPVYRPIFPGMTEADRQVASETLKEGGFSPRVNKSTGQLEVDAASYHE
ncbi:MAG: flagellar M-ring protein FliF, partial [Gammaproteobacteria bacterium]